MASRNVVDQPPPRRDGIRLFRAFSIGLITALGVAILMTITGPHTPAAFEPILVNSRHSNALGSDVSNQPQPNVQDNSQRSTDEEPIAVHVSDAALGMIDSSFQLSAPEASEPINIAADPAAYVTGQALPMQFLPSIFQTTLGTVSIHDLVTPDTSASFSEQHEVKRDGPPSTEAVPASFQLLPWIQSATWQFAPPSIPPSETADPNPHLPVTVELSAPTFIEDHPVVYLTFDDGPHPLYTPHVLKLLERHNAHASFFVIGRSVDAYPQLVQAIQQAGSSVHNHTYDHPNVTHLSEERFNTELTRASRSIEAVTGQTPTCMRPPYGIIDNTTHQRAKQLGLDMVLWNVDPQDWKQPGVDAIVSSVVNNVQPGSVVLLHDGGGDRTQTIVALDQILTLLAARGYRFESLCP